MKSLFLILAAVILFSCNAMKKLADGVYIQQRSPVTGENAAVDSLLIVANGSSATQRIMEDVIPIFTEGLKKRGVNSASVFVSYTDKRISEPDFNKQNYNYILWIYEQDRKLQKLGDNYYLIPLAMKLTDDRNGKNIWIATSIFNDIIKKRFYNERYAGTLILLFRANGIIK